jgi:hypothetical protein
MVSWPYCHIQVASNLNILQLIDGLRVQIYKENASYFRFNQFFFRLGLQLYE